MPPLRAVHPAAGEQREPEEKQAEFHARDASSECWVGRAHEQMRAAAPSEEAPSSSGARAQPVEATTFHDVMNNQTHDRR